MPIYDYRCYSCNSTEERCVDYKDRLYPVRCDCGSFFHYVFPVKAAFGFQPQEAYYDESLGCDVHGKREQKQIMSALGLIQAGDTVNGGRNSIDPNDHFVTIDRQPAKGIRYSDNQRRAERGKEHARNAVITTMHKDGTEKTFRNKDASIDTRKGFKVRSQVPGTTNMRDVNRTGTEKQGE